MKVEVFDEHGQPGARRRKGSWSARCRFPSMPVGFWNDPDGRKYHAAYFERFPGVWTPRRLRRAHRARRRDHLRPIRRRAESRRRAHRHGGDLSPGRAARRSAREPGHRAAVGRRRADRAVRAAARRRARSTTGAGRSDPPPHPPATPRRATSRRASCRSPRFRGRRAARSSSWPSATSCTAAPVKNREALANPEALDQFRDRTELELVLKANPVRDRHKRMIDG